MIFKITEQEFDELFAIQFQGAQQRKTYSLHVEAKMKSMLLRNKKIRLIFIISFSENNEIRKSNVISVISPLEVPIKESISDRYFPYITINGESAPSDARLESRFIVSYNIQIYLSAFEIIILCYYIISGTNINKMKIQIF
jgi:hypothetical protein